MHDPSEANLMTMYETGEHCPVSLVSWQQNLPGFTQMDGTSILQSILQLCGSVYVQSTGAI